MTPVGKKLLNHRLSRLESELAELIASDLPERKQIIVYVQKDIINLKRLIDEPIEVTVNFINEEGKLKECGAFHIDECNVVWETEETKKLKLLSGKFTLLDGRQCAGYQLMNPWADSTIMREAKIEILFRIGERLTEMLRLN